MWAVETAPIASATSDSIGTATSSSAIDNGLGCTAGQRPNVNRAPWLVLLDGHFVALGQLEHGQEGDRDNDAVGHVAQQLLEHDVPARDEELCG